MMHHSLYNAIHSVILHEWDPIGVGDLPEAQDEYNSYVGKISTMLEAKKSVEDIADYLTWARVEHMGLTLGSRENDAVYAAKIVQIASDEAVK